MIRVIHGVEKISGELTIPPSKSHGQRALACALINDHETVIRGLGISDDERAILELIRGAGAELHFGDGVIRVSGGGYHPSGPLELSCNESGLGARMMTPILANSSFPVRLNGKGSLLKRTMHVYDEIMGELKVDFRSDNGKLPFDMTGPLMPATMEIDGSLSSQFVTGVILGYVASPHLREEVLSIKTPASIPYIELTLDVLSDFGIELEFNNDRIRFSGPYSMCPTDIVIEGDWSSASFFLVAGAIAGDVTVKGLNIRSKQADIRLLDALKDFGAGLEISEHAIRVYRKQNQAFTFDATHCPDLFPPLAVLASFAEGESMIAGVNRLTHKESNRAESIRTELNKMGANITVDRDVMLISGVKNVHCAEIDPHGDHRIAMAASIMGLRAAGSTIIQDPQVVNKSFPAFFEYLEKLK